MARLRRDPLPIVHCANEACGVALRPGGKAPRNPEQGRYCMKEDCQALKYKRAYEARAPKREDAPTVCACCEDPLPPRKVRRGDSPFGRWCRKRKCQDNRDLVHQLQAAGAGNSAQAAAAVAFAEAALDPSQTATCPECGLEDGVAGFIHPEVDSDGEIFRCDGLGEKPVPLVLAQKRWARLYAQKA